MRSAAIVIGAQMLAALGVAADSPDPRPPVAQSALPAQAPLISLWYRGSPAGTPREQDLAAIRARGFTGITWPSRQTAGEADVSRMAAALNLQVTLRIDPVPLTGETARAPGEAVDVSVAATKPDEFAAMVWRAVAHGARIVSFDAGATAGIGLTDAAGHPRPWLEPALALGRQIASQAPLIETWHRLGSAAVQAPAPSGLDVMRLEDGRSWILVVTNTSRGRLRAVVRLPVGMPAALWVNLLDGSLLSMINDPAGPRWRLDLEAGAARVYVVNMGSHLVLQHRDNSGCHVLGIDSRKTMIRVAQ